MVAADCFGGGHHANIGDALLSESDLYKNSQQDLVVSVYETGTE